MMIRSRARALLLLAGGVGCIHGAAALAGTFKHITIDGDFTDWAGVTTTYSDPAGLKYSAGLDFKDVWVAHDADYVYLHVSFYNQGDWLNPQNNVYINADGDPTTGYGIHRTGSEILIQEGIGYQEKNGSFNDGFPIEGLQWASAPQGLIKEFEFRISRHATYVDGTPVFTSPNIGILLQSQSGDFGEVDIAGNDGPMEYTLDPAPSPAKGNFELVSLTGSDWRFDNSGTDLGTDWRTLEYDDSQAGWESGRGLFGRTAIPAIYPAPVTTPLAEDHTTCYFRTTFTWTNDTDGLSLIASNLLSAGAVFYLNGAPVGRLRVPAGSIDFNSPSLSTNSAPGQFEVLDFPANALVVGRNVLAVEVHESTAVGGDLVFGMSLLAGNQVPVAIAEPQAPQNVQVDEGSTTTFAVRVRGTGPISFQWFKGTNAIPGATNAVYTLSPVGSADAGVYHVEVSNALAQNVASPQFTLQPRPVPVTITDSSLPADATVTEGNPVLFTVSVSGSTPISFQWFKDGANIPGATNQSYQIPSVLPAQAGAYACTVSNRVAAPMTSRAAILVVAVDTSPPALVSTSGGGTKVVLQFSEPIDAASLQASQFSLSPATAITAAGLNPDDPSAVWLSVPALTFGTAYTVTLGTVQDRFGNAIAPGLTSSFRATILIDGDFSDWAGVPMAYSAPNDVGAASRAAADFRNIWIASDENYVYLRMTLWRQGDPLNDHNNIYIDADNNPDTGYAFNDIGSDLLIQGGVGYEQLPGLLDAGGIADLDWLAAPSPPGTDFEMRFSRQARYVDPAAGGLVFRGNSFALALESQDSVFATRNVAPPAGSAGITYTFQDLVFPDNGAIAISRRAGGLLISWGGSAPLQQTAGLDPANWLDLPGAASPYLVTPGDLQKYYRLKPSLGIGP